MQRVVFLVDMNAFFISCEATRHPELRGKPAAVAGDQKRRAGIILTANYEARAFGVKTAETIQEAKKSCPDLVLITPDHKFYSKMSRYVMELLGGFSPVIQQNSIDEAWLDMTGSENIFGTPLNAAQKIMSKIKNELGLWCSIGISENKFLAKMASDMKKPLGITELWQKDIREKMWPLPVESMYGVGARTAERLKNHGMYTIGDIALYGKSILPHTFGKYGTLLFNLANGIDNEPVTPRRENTMKSIGRSTTLPHDLTDFEDARRVLLSLAEEVGADARRHSKKGTTVQITVKYSDFSSITRQSTVPATFLTKDICEAGTRLLKNNWVSRPVRLIGISLSGFESEAPQQLSFFTQKNEISSAREESLEKTVDVLREKYGDNTIKRAALLEHDSDK
jgi:DNA polymerase-4